ncbi:Aste57867_4029 [Aphanomyces stellatus]|uniref:Aste57867_4029 protein n=1 Tax=Aphanomyces stellatus TaxID=120398 RepID=A0A485KBZ4_9STRA|nr:hypothetical protein As57867_004018 [Aphanomyces stellatus]VFT81164.1 Aste57867_4029 [Aphanomyces stellatus]
MLAKATRPIFFDASVPLTNTTLLLTATIPVTHISIAAVKPLLGVERANKMLAAVVSTAVAAILDSLAMVLAPDVFYGGAGDGLGKADAWTLWGASWGLVWSIDLDSFTKKV